MPDEREQREAQQKREREQKQQEQKERDRKERKTENFASVEEAVENAGSSVLSHLGSRAHKLTREEVEEYEEENGLRGEPKEGEYRAYAGPYYDEGDERNMWTADQDAAAVTP